MLETRCFFKNHIGVLKPLRPQEMNFGKSKVFPTSIGREQNPKAPTSAISVSTGNVPVLNEFADVGVFWLFPMANAFWKSVGSTECLYTSVTRVDIVEQGSWFDISGINLHRSLFGGSKEPDRHRVTIGI